MAITIDGTNGLSSDNAALKLDGTTLAVDETNNRVGVGTASPAVAMDVVGQVRASTGILFGSDTAAANALDDYEEGTWTPTVTGAGGTIGAQAYSVQAGRYIKIGRFVLLTGYLILTDKGSWSGNARIDGLPFTVTNESASYSASNFYYANVTLPANNFSLGAYVDINTTRAQLFASNNTGTTNSDYAVIGNGSQIGPWQICYFTSS